MLHWILGFQAPATPALYVPRTQLFKRRGERNNSCERCFVMGEKESSHRTTSTFFWSQSREKRQTCKRLHYFLTRNRERAIIKDILWLCSRETNEDNLVGEAAIESPHMSKNNDNFHSLTRKSPRNPAIGKGLLRCTSISRAFLDFRIRASMKKCWSDLAAGKREKILRARLVFRNNESWDEDVKNKYRSWNGKWERHDSRDWSCFVARRKENASMSRSTARL